MFKRITIVFSLFLLLLSTVSAVEYINSCGKDSGWVSSETYILNFTEILDADPQSCLHIDSIANLDSIIIDGQGITITNEKYNNEFLRITNSNNLNNMILRNFTVIDEASSVGQTHGMNTFIRTFTSSTRTVDNLHIENVNYLASDVNEGVRYFMELRIGISGGTGYRFTDMEIRDSIIMTKESFARASSSSHNGARLTSSNIYDSLIITQEELFENYQGNSQFILNITDSVIIAPLETDYIVGGNVNYYGSMIKGTLFADTDFDGVADSDGTSLNSMSTYLNILNSNFVQQWTLVDALDSFGTIVNQDQPLFIINNETVSSLQNSEGGGGYVDFSLATIDVPIVLNEERSVTMNEDLICGTYPLLSNTQCSFTGSDPATSGGSEDYYIGTTSDIKNVLFGRSDESPNAIASVGFSGLIANAANISSNDFTITSDASQDHGFLIVYAQNTDIHNNDFTYAFINSSADYGYINSNSNNPTSLNYYENRFLKSQAANSYEVFPNNCDGELYNNYLDSDVVISSSCTDIDASVYVGYKHIDNNIYYFTIGNYYVDNVGCVDGDVDGICDSSYTSGAVTDTKPLASYPFDFLSNLGNAELIVSADPFTVNATGVLEGENVTLNNGAEIITVGFIHDSDFEDLLCVGYVDESQTFINNNNSGGIEYTEDLTGWTEKAYTYRVACENDFVSSSSVQLNFNVQFDSGTTPGGNGTQGSTSGTSDFSYTGLFSSDLNEGPENAKSLFSVAETPLGTFTAVGFIFLFFAILFGIGSLAAGVLGV